MLTAENTRKWLELFAAKVTENKAYLSDLDSAIGDGDHGNNMWRGVEAMLESFHTKNPETTADILKLTAMTLISKVGGASGPLYGTAFLEMSKKSAETDNIAEIIEAGLSGIKNRGKSTTGEKTMVDVWTPVVDALKDNSFSKSTIEDAVNSTKDLVATKGRASYVGERSIGHLDPGSVSSGYLFECLLEVIS